MAHKKGQGSSRNGRDSNSQRLGVKRFGGEQVTRRHDHRPPARHEVEAGQERRASAKDHTLFALADGVVRFEDHGARGLRVSVLPAAS